MTMVRHKLQVQFRNGKIGRVFANIPIEMWGTLDVEHSQHVYLERIGPVILLSTDDSAIFRIRKAVETIITSILGHTEEEAPDTLKPRKGFDVLFPMPFDLG